MMSLTLLFFVFTLYSTAIAEMELWTVEAQPNYRVRFTQLSSYKVCYTHFIILYHLFACRMPHAACCSAVLMTSGDELFSYYYYY